MMRLKRKLYSDNEKKSGSNIGKIALGTAALTAGAFAAGRRGMLGQNIAKSTNVAWGKLGNTMGSKNMVQNASRKYYKHGLGNKLAVGKDWRAANNEFRGKVGATELFRPKPAQPAQ